MPEQVSYETSLRQIATDNLRQLRIDRERLNVEIFEAEAEVKRLGGTVPE